MAAAATAAVSSAVEDDDPVVRLARLLPTDCLNAMWLDCALCEGSDGSRDLFVHDLCVSRECSVTGAVDTVTMAPLLVCCKCASAAGDSGHYQRANATAEAMVRTRFNTRRDRCTPSHWLQPYFGQHEEAQRLRPRERALWVERWLLQWPLLNMPLAYEYNAVKAARAASDKALVLYLNICLAVDQDPDERAFMPPLYLLLAEQPAVRKLTNAALAFRVLLCQTKHLPRLGQAAHVGCCVDCGRPAALLSLAIAERVCFLCAAVHTLLDLPCQPQDSVLASSSGAPLDDAALQALQHVWVQRTEFALNNWLTNTADEPDEDEEEAQEVEALTLSWVSQSSIHFPHARRLVPVSSADFRPGLLLYGAARVQADTPLAQRLQFARLKYGQAAFVEEAAAAHAPPIAGVLEVVGERQLRWAQRVLHLQKRLEELQQQQHVSGEADDAAALQQQAAERKHMLQQAMSALEQQRRVLEAQLQEVNTSMQRLHVSSEQQYECTSVVAAAAAAIGPQLSSSAASRASSTVNEPSVATIASAAAASESALVDTPELLLLQHLDMASFGMPTPPSASSSSNSSSTPAAAPVTGGRVPASERGASAAAACLNANSPWASTASYSSSEKTLSTVALRDPSFAARAHWTAVGSSPEARHKAALSLGALALVSTPGPRSSDSAVADVRRVLNLPDNAHRHGSARANKSDSRAEHALAQAFHNRTTVKLPAHQAAHIAAGAEYLAAHKHALSTSFIRASKAIYASARHEDGSKVVDARIFNMGRGSGGGGGGASSGSSGGNSTRSNAGVSAPTVSVAGYTRADGTRVSAYTRHPARPSAAAAVAPDPPPGCSKSGSSIYSTPERSSSGRSYASSSSSSAGTVHVSSYTRSNGTVVAGYSRSSPGSGSGGGGRSRK
jgi:hypothetical protein